MTTSRGFEEQKIPARRNPRGRGRKKETRAAQGENLSRWLLRRNIQGEDQHPLVMPGGRPEEDTESEKGKKNKGNAWKSSERTHGAGPRKLEGGNPAPDRADKERTNR